MAKKDDPKEDVVVMGPHLGEGRRPYYRKNEEGVTAGILSPVKDGHPIGENAVCLEHMDGPMYRVTHDFSKSKSRPATTEYRKGWNRIFGGKQQVGQA